MAKGHRGSKKVKQIGKAATRSVIAASAAPGGVAQAAPVTHGPFVDYWQLRMDGASNRLRAAKTIIEHTGTRGSLAENLLRELVAEFLPRRWAVGTGFIVDSAKRVSRQVDVLVYDVMTTSPIYRDGDLVALSPGTAKLAIEVKSVLDAKGIPEALENICSVKELDSGVYGMVFGYDGVKADTFADHVTRWFSTPTGTAARTDRQIPNRIYNLIQEFLVLNEKPDPLIVAAPGTTYWALQAPVPIPRFFLTELLSQLNMDNLRAFLPAETVGVELARF